MTISRAAELEERIRKAEMARLQRQREQVNLSLEQHERELQELLRRQRAIDTELAENYYKQQTGCDDARLALLLRSPGAERQRRVLMMALEQGWTQLSMTPSRTTTDPSSQQYYPWYPAWSKR